MFANTPKGSAGIAVILNLIRASMEYGLDPYITILYSFGKGKNHVFVVKKLILFLSRPV